MNRIINIPLFFGCFIMLFASWGCKKDNYAPPDLTFSGRITYQGTPIEVKNNNGGTVYFELWQSGFGSTGAIQIFLNQEGSFSSLLFPGSYKMVIPPSQGPFMSIKNDATNSDTTILELKESTNLDIEVLPYYMISNASFSLAADSTVTASCSVSQIITGINSKAIESVSLFVNRTSFVDDDNNVSRNTISGGSISDLTNISFKTKIPINTSNANIGNPNQNSFYARIGLKITGIDDMIFSSVQKIDF